MNGSRGRILQMRSAALGAMRRDLITSLGTERAKGFLLRYGWSLGQEDAASLKAEQSELSDSQWLKGGPLLHTEAGMVKVEPVEIVIDRKVGVFRVQGLWKDSFEAQTHLQHFGRAPEPVCWTLVGYAGGYASTVFGRRILFKEVSCVATGDAVCRFVGLPAEEWGVRIVRDLPLYEEEVLGEELESAHQRIRQQNSQLQQVVAVHDALSRVLLGGRGLGALAEAVGRLLGSGVTVEDIHLRLLAQYLPVGGSVTAAVTLGNLVQEDGCLQGRLHQMAREKRAMLLPARKDLPMAQDLVVAPILIGDELLGFVTMWVVEGLTLSLTRMVAERAALACALELLKERTAQEVEQRLRGDFVENLLMPEGDGTFLERWAQRLGLRLTDADHRLFLLQPERQYEAESRGQGLSPLERLQKIVYEVVSDAGHKAFWVHRGGCLVVLLPSEGVEPDRLATRIYQQAAQARIGIWVGISRPFQGATPAYDAYEEARVLLSSMREGNCGGPVMQVDRLGAMHLLMTCATRPEVIGFSRDLLGALVEYDAQHKSDLVHTLHQYLRHEGNLQQTAQMLNISISGLKYRLQRLREVGNIDLDDPERRFDLMVALRLLLLREQI